MLRRLQIKNYAFARTFFSFSAEQGMLSRDFHAVARKTVYADIIDYANVPSSDTSLGDRERS